MCTSADDNYRPLNIEMQHHPSPLPPRNATLAALLDVKVGKLQIDFEDEGVLPDLDIVDGIGFGLPVEHGPVGGGIPEGSLPLPASGVSSSWDPVLSTIPISHSETAQNFPSGNPVHEVIRPDGDNSFQPLCLVRWDIGHRGVKVLL